MKASQEAQAEAYREMSRTNKMRDDDALFNSIKVYDGSNPAKFEKWMDSIDQATCITGRDLRKELMKKSDGVIRNSLTMMDATWSDDDIYHEQSQGGVEVSIPGTRRANHCVYLQIWPNAFSLHRHQVRKGNSSICYYRIHFSIGTSAQQGCSKEIHRCQEQALYLGGSLPVGRTMLEEDAEGQFTGSELFIEPTIECK